MKNTYNVITATLIVIFCITSVSAYAIGPTAAVIIAGAKIKARKVDDDKKYPRSKCPICKGTGKVKEGDGTVEVIAECPHCYPDKSGDLPPEEESTTEHPPVILSPKKESDDKCKDGKCPIPSKPTTIYRR